MEPNISISLDQAIDLCRQYLEKHEARLFTQCWGCLKFSYRVPQKMCFYKPPYNNGCRFVNELYKKQK
jgi:hypothetical protein